MDVPASKIIVPPAIVASNGVESRPPPAVELAMASFCGKAFEHTDSKERFGVVQGGAVD